jgi:hypothetical protein
VSKVYPDGDVRITISAQTWTLNPALIILVSSGSSSVNQLPAAGAGTEPTPKQQARLHNLEEILIKKFN